MNIELISSKTIRTFIFTSSILGRAKRSVQYYFLSIGDSARAIYFYGPMGITVICNICLFISTALKIVQHKKDTAHHLKGMDSRRHDDNKQWFVHNCIYLLY